MNSEGLNYVAFLFLGVIIPILIVFGLIFGIKFCMKERKHVLMWLIIVMSIFLAFICSGSFIGLIKNLFT